MKKIIVCVLSIIMMCITVCSFTACKNSNIEEDDGVFVKGDKIYFETDANKTELKISFVEKGFGREWIVQIAKHFVRENKEIMVVLDGDSELSTTLSTKLEAGRNLSDIYMPLAIMWQPFAMRDWLEPLDDLYAMKPDGEAGKTVLEKTSKTFKEYGTVSVKGENHFYAVPWNENITGIVYNNNMFKKYGWTIPTTVNELVSLCDKILLDTNGKVSPFVYPGQIGGYFDFLGSAWWLQASGVEGLQEFFKFESKEVYNPSKQPSLGKKQALEAFDKVFGNSVMKYSVSGSMSKGHITAQMDFLNEKAAMIPNAGWLETEMKNSITKGFEMKMMRTPYLDTAKKDSNGEYVKISYAATPDLMLIPKMAKNKEIAKKFLAFMIRDDMLKLYTKYTGTARPFEYNLDDITGLTPFAESCLDIWKTSESFFDMSKSILYYKNFTTKFLTSTQPYSPLVYGDTTPAKFCNAEYLQAQSKWEQWVSDAKS